MNLEKTTHYNHQIIKLKILGIYGMSQPYLVLYAIMLNLSQTIYISRGLIFVAVSN